MSSIDYDTIRAEARAQVDAELAEVTDPRQRREVAEEIREQAFLELSLLKEERQQLVAAAALWEYSPELHTEFGIARTHLRRLTMDLLRGGLTIEEQHNPPSWPADRPEAARNAGIPHPEDVVEKAAAVCARFEAATARRSAARDYLEEVEEELRAIGGRVRVAAVERPDFHAIREQARQEIADEFAGPEATTEARLRRIAQVVDLWEEKTEKLLPRRNAALLSLACYTTARGVYYSAGISRNAYNQVLANALGLPDGATLPKRDQQPAAARAAGVRFVKNAERKLPAVAKRYEDAKARHSAALQIRKKAIREIAECGWTPVQIAEAIDRDPKAVRFALDASPKS